MPRMTAAALAVRALEQVGVTHTFGIPGVHNTEIYDELGRSEQITPVLVTSEFGGGFMADAASRVGEGIGCLVLVPAAGVTHAASGIGEAYLDGIPMLVITGGVRREKAMRYQLHEIDQLELARGLTKGAYRVTSHAEVASTIHAAYELATSGTPGPVLVEIPVDLQMTAVEVDEPVAPAPRQRPALPPAHQLDKVADFLASAQHPVIYAGWGTHGATAEVIALAERLEAPVVTTLQGLGCFPHDHPLHAGFGFGPAAVPAARNAVKGHDAMLALGARFGEIATGSYAIEPPTGLVHVDINPEVFDANYPAKFTLTGDAGTIARALLERLDKREFREPNEALREQIKEDKAAYAADFRSHDAKGRINPAEFFAVVRLALPDDAIVTVDDGNHTFLTAELFEVRSGGRLISPTDFNAMGYAVPAAVAAKLTNPDKEVVSFVGDGCFRMTALELATARAYGLGLVVYVFNDGELAQIAQAQQVPYNEKTCTVLPDVAIEGMARACGAAYLTADGSSDLAATVQQAQGMASTGQAVVVDLRMDYSRKTTFTKAIVQANFQRFPLRDKARLAVRAARRRL